MVEKEPQCPKCSHNLNNTSCGSCADQGSDLIKNIADELGLEPDTSEEAIINDLKNSCKIILKNPEEFNDIDPYNCRFYLSSALKFF